jgi:hypothetical protein
VELGWVGAETSDESRGEVGDEVKVASEAVGVNIQLSSERQIFVTDCFILVS